ncbi:hypothetical protein CDAR_424641 [Caerostris darwini]|uniref:Transmembrane protein n=1 Tax=Caerostris darwini TaxID=1538125 RepID=A0AAV4VBG2_9ARAC|nr:hypothetical protein CDAR_424641 [Caerostris darwini]
MTKQGFLTMNFKRLTFCFCCITILLLSTMEPCLAGHMKMMKKMMKLMKKHDSGPSTKFLGVKGIFVPIPMPINIDLKKMMMKW